MRELPCFCHLWVHLPAVSVACWWDSKIAECKHVGGQTTLRESTLLLDASAVACAWADVIAAQLPPVSIFTAAPWVVVLMTMAGTQCPLYNTSTGSPLHRAMLLMCVTEPSPAGGSGWIMTLPCLSRRTSALTELVLLQLPPVPVTGSNGCDAFPW